MNIQPHFALLHFGLTFAEGVWIKLFEVYYLRGQVLIIVLVKLVRRKRNMLAKEGIMHIPGYEARKT
jgi:hypothetical protein